MPGNAYARADALQRRAKARDRGFWGWIAPILPLAGAVAAVPLLRTGFYGFVDGPESTWADGFGGAVARIGLGLAAALALSTYAAVVRGPDRGVIDLHPLRPGPWLRAKVASLVRDRLPWLGLGVVLLAPLAARPEALALGVAVLAGAWAAGLGAALGVDLAAPEIGLDPRWAGVLDAVRGHNPRMQAALIYAPGVALAVSGAATLAASSGAASLLRGDAGGILGLLAPFAVAGAGLVVAARSAAGMAKLPALLGEIEAAWAGAESPEEARRVYLEWAVRFAPAALRRDLLKELRHLWRGQRSWVTGSWGLAALAFLAGWTAEASGPTRLAWIGGAALAVLGYAAVRLAATDPEWLDAVLPQPKRPLARALAVWGVMQPVVIAGAAALAVRQGWSVTGLRLEAASLLFAGLGAGVSERLRGGGAVVYVPVGMLMWAVGGVI